MRSLNKLICGMHRCSPALSWLGLLPYKLVLKGTVCNTRGVSRRFSEVEKTSGFLAGIARPIKLHVSFASPHAAQTSSNNSRAHKKQRRQLYQTVFMEHTHILPHRPRSGTKTTSSPQPAVLAPRNRKSAMLKGQSASRLARQVVSAHTHTDVQKHVVHHVLVDVRRVSLPGTEAEVPHATPLVLEEQLRSHFRVPFGSLQQRLCMGEQECADVLCSGREAGVEEGPQLDRREEGGGGLQ